MSSASPAPKLSSHLKVYFVGLLGSLFLRLINSTLRWQVVGLDAQQKLWVSGKPAILAFWHGQQLLMPWIYFKSAAKKNRKPIAVLISQHEDGRMVAKAMKFLGVQTVSGSSSRGGTKALFDLIDKLKSGSHIALTPDGPKGPRCKVGQGIVRIAQRSGAVIYPTAIASEKKWQFNSWDRMFLPKPFSKVVLMMGEPIAIPEELAIGQAEEYANLVEGALNQLTMRAEERCEPAIGELESPHCSS